MLQSILLFLNAVVKPPTLSEVIEQEMAAATLAAEQARSVIHSHKFQLHMSQARIRALNEWNTLNQPSTER